eukprot:TRINITY_DN4694_c0_g1_i1.p1 TRINITY_DN4694_c0_g1~~TRINITY_DN4694_c0_g1_i1.p1  ORF type:complete len:439 (-),score=101.56 TRINITY_DN4694_c0_g1_i1:12-1298(-)
MENPNPTVQPPPAEPETDKEEISDVPDAISSLSFQSYISNPSNEIVFYDLETTIGKEMDIIEFGAITLDKNGLFMKNSFTTLLRSSKITNRSTSSNGITFAMVQNAPTFSEVADRIFEMMDGKIWAGHNIITFDNKHLVNEFKRLNKKPPTPTGLIDTLVLLRTHFGARAGSLKMEALGHYFGLGTEKHRALSDCEMTIEVFKNACMTLFLEQHILSTQGDKDGANKKKTENKTPKKRTPKKNTAGNSSPNKKDTTPSPAKAVSENGEQSTTPMKSKNAFREELVQKINSAISQKTPIWISYNGGTTPLIARSVSPTSWMHQNNSFSATCGSGKDVRQFTVSKIVDIGISQEEIEQRRKTSQVVAAAPSPSPMKTATGEEFLATSMKVLSLDEKLEADQQVASTNKESEIKKEEVKAGAETAVDTKAT